MIAAVIFDMDGLLVDSEPIWRDVEVRVFNALGVPLIEAMAHETTGLRVDEVARYWFARHPWAGPGCDAVAARLIDEVEAAIRAGAVAKPGVADAIAACRARGLRLALASSSSWRLIRATLDRLALNGVFEALASGEDEPRGKPDPGIYRTVVARLGLTGDRCVALEDSWPGVRAAKAAGLRCVAVPERPSPAIAAAADVVLDSLAAFDGALLDRLDQTR